MIYIHIPFCSFKCHYCSFNSIVSKESKNRYFASLYFQLKNDLKSYLIQKNSITSVFFGGGTPSCVDGRYYEKIFEILEPYLVKKCEITFEANPESATYEWLAHIKELGANRISFGVQSFNEKKLKFLTRIHSADEAKNAIKNAQDVGFENISLDLIYGTKLDTKDNLIKDLKEATLLPITHLSAYMLTIEDESIFSGKFEYQRDDNKLFRWFVDEIKNCGFEQYEISNFGKKSQHNLGYWQYKEYFGFGAGAVGRVKEQRYYVTKNLNDYIKDPLFKTIEQLSSADIIFEKIFLGLRSCVGLELSFLEEKHLKKIEILLKEKKLEKKNSRVFNTDYFLSDEIALYICE